MSDRTLARLTVVLAATLSSTSGFFVESPILAEIPQNIRPLVLCFWRVAFAAVVFLPVVKKYTFHPVMLLSGLCVFGNGIMYITSMVLTTPGTAMWLQNLTPFWVLIFSVMFLHEKLTLRGLLPMAVALAGVGLILGFTLYSEGLPAMTGLVTGVLAGVFFAGVLCSFRWLRGYDSNTVVMWNILISLACFFPLMLWTGYVPTWPQLGMFAAFGIFQFALPYLLIARGLSKITAQEGVLITLLEPILTPVWVFLVWGKGEPWWTIVGGGLVLGGLLLRCFMGEKTEKEPQV